MKKMYSLHSKIAIITEQGEQITYSKLFELMKLYLLYPTDVKNCLVVVVCDNSLANICIYLSYMKEKIPMILVDASEYSQLSKLVDDFAVDAIWSPVRIEYISGFVLKYEIGQYAYYERGERLSENYINPKIALLLSTSGSEGENKFVVLSYENIYSNTLAIVSALKISRTDRAAIMLPICYSYGLSIINTHLYMGATLLLPNTSIVQLEFWKFMDNNNVTSLATVPHGYEYIRKMKLLETKFSFKYLRMLTQAGGALRIETQKYYLKLCKRRFQGAHIVIMYGQTETTARISSFFLDENESKMGSVGKVIPKGKLWILGDGNEGEIYYEGANVFWGYAKDIDDLKKIMPSNGILNTGDVGYLDKDGFLYITGRKKRIAKINGYRVGLDALQKELSDKIGCEIVCVAVQDYEKECIEIFWDDPNILQYRIKLVMDSKLKLKGGWRLKYVEKFPYKYNGKIDYTNLSCNC